MKEKSAKKGERSRKSCGIVQGSLRYEGDSWKQNSCTDCQCTAVRIVISFTLLTIELKKVLSEIKFERGTFKFLHET